MADRVGTHAEEPSSALSTLNRSNTRTSRKVLWALYATLFALCNIVIVATYLSDRESERKAALDGLGTLTATVSAQLNDDHLSDLLERYDGRGMIFKNTQDAWYYVMHDQLRRAGVRALPGSSLQVLSFDKLKQELQVIVTDQGEPRFRQPFDGDAAAILAAYERGGHITSRRSAHLHTFDPIRKDDGTVVGVVLGRIPVEHADRAAVSSLWRISAIALALFLFAGSVLFTSVGRWLKRAEVDHEDLHRRHTDITDSIAYAGKIQRALVPSSTAYAELFDGSFIIDRPKDVVSGDFHWVHRIDAHTCIVAAADCTGHGLPGAMMAAIGCSLLNEVVSNHPDQDPAELLSMLNTRLVITLHQQGNKRGAGDGMDIALCRIDRRRQEILFAGAMRPLYWLHRGQLTVINGDRKPVGGAHHSLEHRFTCHRLAYAPGDRIYLFSDGYVDQFGGPERRRFMANRLHALLQEHSELPMERQAEVLEEAFLTWKGNEEQVDDICLLGLAV